MSEFNKFDMNMDFRTRAAKKRVARWIREEEKMLTEKHGAEMIRRLKEGDGLSEKEWSECSETLERDILIHRSPIDVDRLAEGLQGQSQRMLHLAVLTSYRCGRCGKENRSSSSFIPRMCMDCARKEAEAIIIGQETLLKDGVRVEMPKGRETGSGEA